GGVGLVIAVVVFGTDVNETDRQVPAARLALGAGGCGACVAAAGQAESEQTKAAHPAPERHQRRELGGFHACSFFTEIPAQAAGFGFRFTPETLLVRAEPLSSLADDALDQIVHTFQLNGGLHIRGSLRDGNLAGVVLEEPLEDHERTVEEL